MFRLITQLSLSICWFLASQQGAWAEDDIVAVQIYSQDELIELINRNEHLARVVADRCQLVQDIEQEPKP